jgi:nicotinamide-nucleotide amidase
MQELLGLAERIGGKLKARKQTVAIAESSTGSVISTRQARRALLGIGHPLPEGIARASTQQYAALLAATVRESMGATWGLGETGAAGPTGNSYGDAAGHSCMALAGPTQTAITLETGNADRVANMRAFALRALELLDAALV